MKWFTNFLNNLKYQYMVSTDRELMKKKWMANSVNRAKKTLKHPLHLNNTPLIIKIQRLVGDQQIIDTLTNLTDFNYELCYMINSTITFEPYLPYTSVDLIVTDLNWKVYQVYEEWNNDKPFEKLHQTSHLFIMAPHSIKVLGIKVNDFLRPMPKQN